MTIEHHSRHAVRTIPYGLLPSQVGDLYLPQTSLPPVVCLLHGGFWRMPYRRDELDAIAQDLAVRGFAVWNLEYRRLGEPGGGWPGTFEDVAAGIDHLAILVDEGADLDLHRVIVAGHSAGGHLALWAATGGSSHGIHGPSRVRPIAAAGLAAVADLASGFALGAGNGAVAGFLGGSPDDFPERYVAASPMARLPLGVRQLILHGTLDAALPIEIARGYVAAARASGDRIDYVELADAGHMDFLDPLSQAHAEFCAWLEKKWGQVHS
ncbi:MAG TPA: alpha/beta hydrolase [Xanthomonadaceae bacterium]|nr:alpha/beta hydrolase [Xanthomonadaceae bacterium]